MSTLHKEIQFEDEICDNLSFNGWLYSLGDAASYDRARALFPTDITAWLETTQAEAWNILIKNHGSQAIDVLLDRLRVAINQQGILQVLRHGIDIIGLRQPLKLAEFKPALAMNPDILAKYEANRLRVVRQVRYSLHNENAIDLVLFLNGLPMATVELKSDFTQSVGDAVDQYRFDRVPRPKGQNAGEPLLTFPQGALVHFAVSNSEVMMTTKLNGPGTRFLPFNCGDHGAAGNPPNAHGHRTAYLWEEIWARDSWLEILGRYVVGQKNDKKELVSYIFPRFHQLDMTRKLTAAVVTEGVGGKYLIQHSAGSGKTKSIAWTAHLLSDLHDAQHEKLFSTVLVVSDRTVLDDQLQDDVFAFERTKGVVEVIKGEGASKSEELSTALAAGKKIIVCTIQTFPFALEKVQELAATQNKRFAVIADEAHSSQTGEAAAKLKTLLSQEELTELADGGEYSTEDLLAMQMAAKAKPDAITYVAFTATPKPKTLELFGRRPNPNEPAGASNLPEPFHVYSMRQAIEEKFILDVLKNYTQYSLAFKLARKGKEIDEREIESGEALKGILRWVRLNPHNIASKVQVVVEHFQMNVQPLLEGKAKAMVVTASRLEAVRWKLAIDAYIREKAYLIGTIVAFSGEVDDPESGPQPFTEMSKALNPTLNRREIRKAFDTDEFQILLVANKFQTGFDQSLLCGMYVDKKLSGISAVQTLSRLNRSHEGKDTTYVLDFVNSGADILKEFQKYYATATLSGITDPNIVYSLRMKLDGLGFYDDAEVDRVVEVELNPRSKQSDLAGALEPVVSRILMEYKDASECRKVALNNGDQSTAARAKDTLDALVIFKKDIGTYQRVYSFLSQIFDYGNTEVEKRSIFYRRLLPLLEFGRERDTIDLSGIVLTHYSLKNQGERHSMLPIEAVGKLHPITEAGAGAVREKEKSRMDEIIEKVNDLFDGELTESDRVIYVNEVIKAKLLESPVLTQQAENNTKEQFAHSSDLKKAITDAIMDAMSAHITMSTQALNSEQIQKGLREILLGLRDYMKRYACKDRVGKGELHCELRMSNYMQRIREECLELDKKNNQAM